jgi:undecaprenyl phosphate-alpha-L-ara4N flippase subunit ArnE
MTVAPLKKPAVHPTPFLLLGLLLAMDVAAFLFEKKVAVAAAGFGGSYFLALIRQPLFWASLALGPFQLWTWTKILSRIDLSIAYPISGLNLPMTLIGAVLILGEHLSPRVWLGTILITAGGAIIGPAAGEHQPAGPIPPG